MSLEVDLEQPEEGMLRQEESHTQGQELPALQCNTTQHWQLGCSEGAVRLLRVCSERDDKRRDERKVF